MVNDNLVKTPLKTAFPKNVVNSIRELTLRCDRLKYQKRLINLVAEMNKFGMDFNNNGKPKNAVKFIGDGGGRPAFDPIELEFRHWLEDKVVAEFAGKITDCYIADDNLRKITVYEKGIIVEQNPAGTIIRLTGRNPKLRAIGIGSHTDTIKSNAGRYDGQLGVATALLTLETIVESGLTPERSIEVILPTGEDTFMYSFIGSILFTRGLKDEKELDAPIDAGCTLGQGLRRWAESFGIPDFDPKKLVSCRLLPKDEVDYFFEVHAEPTDKVLKDGHHLAAVEFIMGADRWLMDVGSSKKIKIKLKKHQKMYKIGVTGPGGHTAASMERRADALPKLYRLLKLYHNLPNKLLHKVNIHLIQMTNRGEALAKIPSDISVIFMLDSDDQTAIIAAEHLLRLEFIHEEEMFRAYKQNGLGAYQELSFTWQDIPVVDVLQEIYELVINPYLLLLRTAKLISSIELISRKYERLHLGHVATVSLCQLLPDGRIRLGFDVRGFELRLRDELMQFILNEIAKHFNYDRITSYLPLEDFIKLLNHRGDLTLGYKSEKNIFELIKLKDDMTRYPIHITYPLPGSEKPGQMSAMLAGMIERSADIIGARCGERLKNRAGEDAIVYDFKYKQMIMAASNGLTHTKWENVKSEDAYAAFKNQLVCTLQTSMMTDEQITALYAPKK